MIAGILLAAGHASRMGRSKARISIDGEAALVRLVRIFGAAGLDPILVVGPAALADLAVGARLVDGDPDGEMIDSLARGIEGLPAGIEAVVVQPVDAPFTSIEGIQALIAATDRPRVLAFEETPGHPVLVPRALWPAIRARPSGGLRALLEDADRVAWDRSVLADLDTPADLVRWKIHD